MNHRVRPTPVEQMRERLEVARGRRTPFERAWPHALRTIDYPKDWRESREWRAVLNDTVTEWRAAYLGEEASPMGSACGTLALAAA